MNQASETRRLPPLSRGKVLLLAGLSSASLFAALPPLQIWALAWVAPLFWLILVRHPDFETAPEVHVDKASSRGMRWLYWRWGPWSWLWRWARRPYGLIWLASTIHWLFLLYGLSLAHWANNISWIALSMYVGCYAPLFVGLTRVAVNRLSVPLVLAAPVVWTGLELVRAYMFTGFAGAMLGHTQVRWSAMIQIADTFGDFGVSFVVMLFAAGLSQAMPYAAARRWKIGPVIVGIVVVAANLAYGHWRLREEAATITKIDLTQPKPAGAVRIALVQCSYDTVFEINVARDLAKFDAYLAQSKLAQQRWPELNLIVWPEGTFEGDLTETLIEGKLGIPPGHDEREVRDKLAAWQNAFSDKLRYVARFVNQRKDKAPTEISLLVGTATEIVRGLESKGYNTALLIGPRGKPRNRYHKMHLVPFGEFMPFAKHFSWLAKLTPLGTGISPGAEPKLVKIGSMTATPSICFESMTPRVIRRQVNYFREKGYPPQILINMTNDGWFWGSSVLDIHYHCAIFRAIENRRHLLIAANTGISAWIDPYGQARARAPRREKHAILCQIEPPTEDPVTTYMRIGDLPAHACAAFCYFLALLGWWGRRAAPAHPNPTQPYER